MKLVVPSDDRLRFDDVAPGFVTDQCVGGGIYLGGASSDLWMTRCTLRSNYSYDGGGIYAGDLITTHVIDCTIAGNAAAVYGAGVCFGGGEIAGTSITGNTADHGGGVFGLNSVTINGCTISGNLASGWGGGIDVDTAALQISRSILWNNCSSDTSHELYVPSNSSATLSCCIYDPGGMTGPISYLGWNATRDPRFCAPEDCGLQTGGGDYTVSIDSPAAPTQNPCGLIGALEVGCDLAGAADRPEPAAAAFRLTVPAPNLTTGAISCTILRPQAGPVSMLLIDPSGRTRDTFFRGELPAGSSVLHFRLQNDPLQNGARQGRLAPGVYFLRAEGQGWRESRGIVLLRP